MKTIDITFDVIGSVTQNIEILTKDTPDEFLEKIKNGDYLTTISGDKIIRLPDFCDVGIIQNQETLEYSEYNEFELS